MELIRQSVKRQAGRLAVGLVGVILSLAISFATPAVNGFVIDFVLGGDASSLPPFLAKWAEGYTSQQLVSMLWIPALVLLGLSLVNCLFIYVRGINVSKASETIAKDLRDDVYSHLMELPYDYHKHAQTGELVQRCTSDIDTLRRFVGMRLMDLVRTALMILSAFGIICAINWRMAIAASCVVPVIFLVSLKFFSRIKDVFEKVDEAEEALSTMMQENFSGVRVVRAFGQQQSEVEKFAVLNDRHRELNREFSRTDSLFWAFTDTLSFFQLIVSFLYSVHCCLRGDFTVGRVVLFSSYTNMMVWPARQLGRIVADMSKSAISNKRLMEIMNEKAETETGACLTPDIRGDVSFEDVSFSYEDGVKVLDGVTFDVKAGQTVGILGSTGSGKSSLVQLLQRLYRPDSGRITIDGVDVNDIERHHLRKSIGLVLQEPFLYSRSIMDNLRIAAPDATDEEVYEQARIASVHEVIEGFEKGYDTMVGEKGITLSGGQKQRVAIARMLMQKAPIIVFDDSLSAVDTETDARIREALASVRKNTTTFIISHRITTLCEADKVIVLENGRVSDQGTHRELMEREGLYSRIAALQHFGEDAEEVTG